MLTNLCIKFSINFTYSRNLLQNNVLFIAGHYSCSKFGKFIQIQDYHLGNRITLIQSLVKDSTIIVIIYKAIFLYFCPFTNWKFGKSIQNFDCFRVIGNSFSAVILILYRLFRDRLVQLWILHNGGNLGKSFYYD